MKIEGAEFFAMIEMVEKRTSPNRGDKMRRVADVYAQLSSLKHRTLLSDAERKVEYLRLQRKLDELLAQVWK
jgi:hypothetical protein